LSTGSNASFGATVRAQPIAAGCLNRAESSGSLRIREASTINAGSKVMSQMIGPLDAAHTSNHAFKARTGLTRIDFRREGQNKARLAPPNSWPIPKSVSLWTKSASRRHEIGETCWIARPRIGSKISQSQGEQLCPQNHQGTYGSRLHSRLSPLPRC
jgi:hypothetical protein